MPLLRLQLACARTAASTRAFVAAYLAELGHFASLAPGRSVSSIFFGGGTPSLMAPATVAAILDASRLWTRRARRGDHARGQPDLASRPDDFAGYRAAGVNRVSLGVQSLDDASLKALGRKHTSDEALAALAIAKRNFERVSFDLIYARQGQDAARPGARSSPRARPMRRTISRSISSPSRRARRSPRSTPRRRCACRRRSSAEAFYLLTQELCDAAGLPAYEVSNHARPGAESRHNLLYWRGPRLCRHRPRRP